MATDRNTGAWRRVSNSGLLLFGSALDPIYNLVPGSLWWKLRHRERIPNMDRGVHGLITVGDQRPQEVEFQVYRGLIFEAFRAVLMPSSVGTTGLEPGFEMTVKVADNLGASAFDIFHFTNGYLVDGFEDRADGGGQDVDKVTIHMEFRCDYPTPTHA